MTNRLWGRKTSANVQKVLWALAELDVPFEHTELGGKFGGVDTAAFKAMNPLGLVPVWQEPGLTLFESHAILRHLACVHGRLMPQDPAGAAIADQWMEIASTTFNPALIGVFWQVYRTPPARQNPDAIKDAIAKLAIISAVLDDRLASTSWLGGDSFSLADIAAGAVMHRYWTLPFDRPARPALERWTNALRERPPFREIVETSYEDLRGA